MEFRTGCCGLAGLSLQKYSSMFSVLEVQSTFYRLPELGTATRWRESTPGGFEFMMKVFQGVTHPITSPTWRKAGSQRPKQREERYGHLQPTPEALTSWARSLEIASALHAKACVVQLPPSFICTRENIANAVSFFRQAARPPVVAIEVRHGSWFQQPALLRNMLDEIEAEHVVDPLIRLPARIGEVGYFRLHGLGKERYRYGYTDDDLRRVRDRARDIGVKVAYVMFNNLAMREDASRFREIAASPSEK